MPSRKKLMDFIITALLLYACLMVFLYVYQRNLQYFPAGPRPVIQSEAPYEIIPVTPESDITLEGLYWPGEQTLPTIVFFHGNGQAYQYWADKLAPYRKEGYGVLFADYPGYGGYPGKPTEQGIYNAARAFINALQEKHAIKPDNMVFYGESLGTGVAVQMATEFLPKALILESAYSSTADIAKSRYWMFPVDVLMKDQYRSIDKIGALTMPKLFIHAERDAVIPIRFSQKLYDAAPEQKKIITNPNGGHNDLFENGMALHIQSFLSKISLKENKGP